MRIDVRQPDRKRIGRITIDPALRPTRARIEDGEVDREVFLEWEAATDDAGRLRRCVVCGCRDLYAVRTFPQLTGFVVVLAFAGAVIGLLGYTTNPIVLAALIVVLLLDIGSLVFSRHRLVCYQCRSTYSDVEIARHHRPWDRTVGQKYPPPAAALVDDAAMAPEAEPSSRVARPAPVAREAGAHVL